jgi:hypothetical protein
MESDPFRFDAGVVSAGGGSTHQVGHLNGVDVAIGELGPELGNRQSGAVSDLEYSCIGCGIELGRDPPVALDVRGAGRHDATGETSQQPVWVLELLDDSLLDHGRS